jgi:hypothetical protein
MNVYTNGPTTYITIIARETVALSLQVTDVSNNPINLTGYSLKCQVNMHPATLLLATSNGGITITNAAQGQVQINISDTASAALPAGTYSFDLWMISGGGQATPLLNGFFVVAPAVTPIP